MKKVTFLLLFAMAAFSVTTFAQKKESINKKVTSKAYTGARGAADENIKSGAPKTDKKEAKGARGTCQIYFDNYSGLYVDVYVDGNYKGTLSPSGAFNVYVGDGYTTIYCKSTGGTRYWSDSGNCDGYYHYKLYY